MEYIGMDVHKRESQVCSLSDGGAVVLEQRIRTATAMTAAGAARNGIDKVGGAVLSRGVLLGLARTKRADRLPPGCMCQMLGLGIACVEWLHAREVAAVASDTSAVEVIPFEDELARDCARDGVWEFLFSASPLRVGGGVGSPLKPLAVR